MSKENSATRSRSEGVSAGPQTAPSLRWPLLALLAVLTVVTLTRLDLFAVYENERDALRLLERLSAQLDETGSWQSSPALQSALGNPSDLPRGTQDAEWLEDGQLLRWHGYLFALATGSDGAVHLIAWPWKHGRTGVAAYASAPGLGLVGHSNRSTGGGVFARETSAAGAAPSAPNASAKGPWSGLQNRPRLDPRAPPGGWQRVPLDAMR
jgi:hypothetical protein